MNVLNRLIMALLGAALFAGGVLLLLAANFNSLRTHVQAWMPHAAEGVSGVMSETYYVVAGGALFLLFGLLVLILELRPPRANPHLLLREDSAGAVTILVDSTRRLADHVAEKVESVKEVRSVVIPTPKGLRVRCRVAVDPGASVPELAREVQSRVGAALEHHLGRPVDEVSVSAQITPLSQPRRRRVR